MTKRNVLTALVCFVLCGCNTTSSRDLQIRHTFVPIHKEHGNEEFTLQMTWFVPPSVLFGNEKNSILANMGLKSQTQRMTNLSLNNQTKIRLEDIAIDRLEQEIENNRMCHQGYAIKSTRWLERSILFEGKCL